MGKFEDSFKRQVRRDTGKFWKQTRHAYTN